MGGLPTWTIHNLKGSEDVKAAGFVPVMRPPCQRVSLGKIREKQDKRTSPVAFRFFNFGR